VQIRLHCTHRDRPYVSSMTAGLHARRQYATLQLDPGFPWFFWVLEQMLSQYPTSTLQWMLFMQRSPKLTTKFSAKCHAPNTIKTSSFCCPPNTKSAQKLHSFAAYCQQASSYHLTLFTSQRFSLLLAYLCHKDGRALPGCFGEVNVSAFPIRRSVALLTAPSPTPWYIRPSLQCSNRVCSPSVVTALHANRRDVLPCSLMYFSPLLEGTFWSYLKLR